MRYLFLWDMMQWFPTFQDNLAVQPSRLKSPSSSTVLLTVTKKTHTHTHTHTQTLIEHILLQSLD